MALYGDCIAFCLSYLTYHTPAGSIGAARNLEALRREGVTHILNASPIVPCFHRHQFKYKVVSIYDDAQENIAQFFDETNKYISKVILFPKSVQSLV